MIDSFRTPSRGVAAATAGMLALAFALVGCAPDGDGAPTPSATSPSATPSPAPTASETPQPQEPQFVPDGDAEANLEYFRVIVQTVWGGDRSVQGMAYIDALTDAGFDRSRMQVTSDTTTIGRPAESIQFSVAWGTDECLVGQVGPSTGDPVVAVLPQLAEGRCLVGSTRQIRD